MAVGVGVFAHFVWLRDQGYEFGVVRGRCLRVPCVESIGYGDGNFRK